MTFGSLFLRRTDAKVQRKKRGMDWPGGGVPA